jgi:hypothetical protein
MKNPLIKSSKFLLFFILAVFHGSICLQAQSSKELNFPLTIHDFGQILEADGPVTHEFTFANTTSRPLRVVDVKASCGCTTPGWSKGEIAPGASGFIKAQFDPFNRPGPFTKTLTVITDAAEGTIILTIKGNVVPKPKGTESTYTLTLGNLKFKTRTFNMGKVYTTPQATEKSFPILNSGTSPITFTGKHTVPAYIQVRVEPATLGPGKQGMLIISYKAADRGGFGYLSDNIVLSTDDALLPKKSLQVYATVEEYFPQMSDQEMANAPKASLSKTEVDFGRIKAGDEVSTDVTITNYGKTDLWIRQLSPNCGCLTAEVVDKRIKAGQSSILKLRFNTEGQKSNQLKSVVVYTNDPRNPVQRINIKAIVD